jgi:hypothetical protein
MDRYRGGTIIEIKSRVRPSGVPANVPDDEIPKEKFTVNLHDRSQFTKYAELIAAGVQENVTRSGGRLEPAQRFTDAAYYFNYKGLAQRFHQQMPGELRNKTEFSYGGRKLSV